MALAISIALMVIAGFLFIMAACAVSSRKED